MQFNSLEFILFFGFVVSFYFWLPFRLRNYFLLIASYYFYMCWKLEYVILIILSTSVDYFTGMAMGRSKILWQKKLFLGLSLTFNLSILFFFKYWNFFTESVQAAFSGIDILSQFPAFNVLLPVGISFYTFQSLSYCIDIYRGDRKPETNFLTFAVFVSFFPQLVAGPIERSTRLIPQFYIKQKFDYDRVTSGLRRMAMGFVKKIVVADHLAPFVTQIYADPQSANGFILCLGTIFFAYQID